MENGRHQAKKIVWECVVRTHRLKQSKEKQKVWTKAGDGYDQEGMSYDMMIQVWRRQGRLRVEAVVVVTQVSQDQNAYSWCVMKGRREKKRKDPDKDAK